MVNLDIIKENIQFEKTLGENTIDSPVKEEYLIPDTHPDVHKILTVDVNAVVTNKEVQMERVLVEAQIEYNVIYLAKEDEGLGVNNVIYREKISNFIDVSGAEHRMICDADCELEHINANIINERKISIEAYFRTKCNVFKTENIEFVKDVVGTGDVQTKKKTDKIEKNVANKALNMTGKTQLKVSMDKPQVGKVIKCQFTPHKKEVKLAEDKINTSCLVKVDVVYKAYDSRDIVTLEDEILVSSQEDVIGVTGDMNAASDFRVISNDFKIAQDDLGESRLIDIEVLMEASVKVNKSETMEIIDDTYSPTRYISLRKDKSNVNVTVGEGNVETIVKDNIAIDKEEANPSQIVNSSGKIVSLDNKIVGNKVVIEGILKVDTIYKCNDDEKYLGKVSGEVPFGTSMEIPAAKEGMTCIIKGNLENLQSNIEANTIGVKAVISANCKVIDTVNKEYIKEVEQKDEIAAKKASIIIYVVQKEDTLWGLAKKYNTTMNEIAKLNNLENTDLIPNGEKLIIPGRALI